MRFQREIQPFYRLGNEVDGSFDRLLSLEKWGVPHGGDEDSSTPNQFEGKMKMSTSILTKPIVCF